MQQQHFGGRLIRVLTSFPIKMGLRRKQIMYYLFCFSCLVSIVGTAVAIVLWDMLSVLLGMLAWLAWLLVAAEMKARMR